VRHVDLTREPPSDLLGRSTFKEQIHRLGKVAARGLHRVALTGDVQLGTKSHVAVPLAFDDGREKFPDVAKPSPSSNNSNVADQVLPQ
jgi:hypothetical protein